MQFSNATHLHAAMIPNADEDGRITTLLMNAVTYHIGSDHQLSLAPTQRPLLLESDGRTPHDVLFTRDIVGVCATGFVYPETDAPAKTALAQLRIGTEERNILAFGIRVWKRDAWGSLVPSVPLSFERVAMTWENAYGGIVTQPASIIMIDSEEAFLPEHESGHALNFDGKGFYTSESQALDRPMPQLENTAALIRTWDDRPQPVCFAPYPLWGAMRASYLVKDQNLDIGAFTKIGSRAAPATTFDSIETGTCIALSGMRPRGECLAFSVPSSPISFEVYSENERNVVVPRLDTVEIDAEAAEVRLVFRAKVTQTRVEFARAHAKVLSAPGIAA